MEKLSLINLGDKPAGCLAHCSYNSLCQGFLPDWVPANPKIAFLSDAGGSTDTEQRSPFVGSIGRMFFHTFLEPCGLTRNDVLLANVIKGQPPNNEYPIGQLRKDAEKACRQFDNYHGVQYDNYMALAPGGLDSFDPNLAMVTVHPNFVSRTWSMVRVAQEDIKKSIRLLERGYRVLVLLGSVAQGLVLPDLEGALLKWRGHYQEIEWSKLKKTWE